MKAKLLLITGLCLILSGGCNAKGDADYRSSLKLPTQTLINSTSCEEENTKNNGVLPPSPSITYARQFRCTKNKIIWHLFRGKKYVGSAQMIYYPKAKNSSGSVLTWKLARGVKIPTAFGSENIVISGTGTQSREEKFSRVFFND
jgi:hypothetical protein